MKQLLLINDITANKISYYHVLLLMASLPFDMFYSHIILISFTLHTLIHLDKSRLKSLRSFKLLVLPSVLFITILATIYTINPKAAFTEWMLRIPLLLFPVVFSLNGLDLKKYRENLLMGFSLVCALTVFYLFMVVLVTIRFYHMPLRAIFSEGFTNHNFAGPINIHATFFSFQLVIAFVYFLSILIKGGASRLIKVVCIISCLILVSGMIQLSSKSILIILFVAVNVVLPLYLLNGRQRRRYILTGLLITVTGTAGILSISTFRDRYVTLLKEDISSDKTIPRNSDSRFERWRVAAARIKEKPLLGYGSGSEVSLLKDDFYNAKMYSSFLKGLNSHNQYISFMLKSGIWGLTIYLLTLIYGFKIAFKRKDVMFISFMLIIAVVSLSENILDVDKGVMFYSFFFSFFLFSVPDHETSIKEQQKPDEYLVPLATNALAVTS
ncbi:O-antigen ligase family protein [Mucilaginibacter lappiensis]|uniref:O-antigen ligase n=1 Tax=Mucilaginibacter lappiensis TaxID=354630 RepID=A0A841JDU7_9SPHI|nr:O-antigen ligase family protein [Mucilaginibacter lappiensis]MBB6127756.1 O-antigen ligase [Mucilaginibacter lappiensis]